MQLKNPKLNQDDEDINPENTRHLFREVNLMHLFNHPLLIKFIGYSPTDFKGKRYLTIITEFAINFSLCDLINFVKIKYEKTYINIYGNASVMMHLHEQNVLHHDLKPENILIDSIEKYLSILFKIK